MPAKEPDKIGKRIFVPWKNDQHGLPPRELEQLNKSFAKVSRLSKRLSKLEAPEKDFKCATGHGESKTTANEYIWKCTGMLHARDYRKCIETATIALQSHYSDTRILMIRARAYRALRLHKQALEDCSSVLALNPDTFEAYQISAHVHRATKAFSKAIEAYSVIIEQVKADSVQAGEALVGRAECYAETGDYTQAIGDVTRCLGMKHAGEKEQLRARLIRAECCRVVHHFDKALTDLKIVIDSGKHVASALFLRATIYYDLKQYQEAFNSYSQALLQDDYGDPQSRYLGARARGLTIFHMLMSKQPDESKDEEQPPP